MIARRSPPKRTTRPRPYNKVRRRSRFRHAYHSAERVQWIQSLDCFCCAALPVANMGPIHNAHIGGGSAGKKGHYSQVIPLCDGHHRALHKFGRRLTEETYGIFLDACARATQAAWAMYAARAGIDA